MWRRRYWLACSAVLVQLLVATAAWAFAATPAADRVIDAERADARQLPAVRVERTGAIVYCTSAPEGWTYAPNPAATHPHTSPRRTTCTEGASNE
jgi:hypothetical protein